MKGSNLFYGLALLILAYLINVPTFEINIGVPLTIPNPLLAFGQITILNVPMWVFIGLLGFICLVSAFQEDKRIIVQERARTEWCGRVLLWLDNFCGHVEDPEPSCSNHCARIVQCNSHDYHPAGIAESARRVCLVNMWGWKTAKGVCISLTL